MILLLDVGNSRIKWAAWQDGRWQSHGACPTGQTEALEAVLAAVRPRWVGISHVAGEQVRADLTRLFEAEGIEPFWLEPKASGHGVENRYAEPGSLGVDRYAAAIAVVRMGLAPCTVVSAGTAVTVDAISGKGEFLGGMIMPGAGLMWRSLDKGTAALAGQTGSWRAFPRATGDAIATGIWTAIPAAVAAMHARLAHEAGNDVGLVVTGGDAVELVARLGDMRVAPAPNLKENLVLEGLLWVARDLDVPGA